MSADFYSGATSSVLSVTYGSMIIGLYRHENIAITLSPLNRVIRIIENMPENALRLLLTPIEQGFVDPLTVYYMICDFRDRGRLLLIFSFI